MDSHSKIRKQKLEWSLNNFRMSKKYYLHDNWSVKVTSSPQGEKDFPGKKLKNWIPAEVPGTIHTDLLNADIIDNPFKERNEFNYNWITRSAWTYRTEFKYPEGLSRSSIIKLVFEGLDTAADIFLNHKLIGRTENMFVKYEFNVDQVLNSGRNVLELRFESPLELAVKREKEYGKLSTAKDSFRVYIRKAQYSFGWDWGPSYPTTGIWRPVYLTAVEKAAITSVSFITEKLTRRKARVKIGLEAEVYTKEPVKATIILSRDNEFYHKEIRNVNKKKHNVSFEIDNPSLWWPNGSGEQNLYDLIVSLSDASGTIFYEEQKKVGIRKIDLELSKKDKSVFRFRVNNKIIYMKGMNWIPADSFLPRVKEKKYAELLNLAAEANANMIRVWGGGIYENDEFYDLCDKLGLLVWQDFMFACENYPEHDEFVKTVSEEVTQNVKRLRTHPCIALWCGNNENEWIWYRTLSGSYKEMPGYNLFHKVIPALMKSLSPDLPYRPTSPFGTDDDPNSQTSGNRHQWDIWSNWIDYSHVANDNSLFVTEFGFQGPACLDTFNKILPAGKRKIQSPAFEYYNKQIEGPERVIRFLAAHLPVRTDWDDFIYLAQLNQGLALKRCLEHWRGNRKVTGGSLIWQLNDCWPVTSWSLIDSSIIPKMAYYFVKEAFSDTVIHFRESGSVLKIFVLNEGEIERFTIETEILDTLTGKIILTRSKNIYAVKGKYTEADKINTSKVSNTQNLVIISSLYDEDRNIIHRNFYAEKEWKHIGLADPAIKISLPGGSGSDFIVLTTTRTAFFVDVYHPGITFSDRGFILLPGEKKKLKIIKGNKRIGGENIRIYSLNNYLEQ